MKHAQQPDVHRLQAGDDLNPLREEGLFNTIIAEDCQLLDLPWRPEDLLMTHAIA